MDRKAQEYHAKPDQPLPNDGFNSGGYEWCCENWGVKWDYFADEWIEGDGTLELYFDTAWNAPTEFFRTVAPMSPELHFNLTYEEPGMAFQGEMNAEGESFEDNTWEYEPQREDEECEEV